MIVKKVLIGIFCLLLPLECTFATQRALQQNNIRYSTDHLKPISQVNTHLTNTKIKGPHRKVRKSKNPIHNHHQRVAKLHNTKTKMILALLISFVKICITTVPVIIAAPPAGIPLFMIQLGLLFITPIIMKGVNKGLMRYAKRRIRDPKRQRFFVEKWSRRISRIVHAISWTTNPIGNAAGGVVLKGTDSLDNLIDRKISRNTRRKRASRKLLKITEFITYHLVRILVPTFVDSPLEMLISEVAGPDTSPDVNSDVGEDWINGQDIADRQFDEVIWVGGHNMMHSSESTYTDFSGYLVSQFLANQDSNLLDGIVQDNLSVINVDLNLNDQGDIILVHENIVLGEAEPFFDDLAGILEGDSDKMIVLMVQNDGVPVDQLYDMYDDTGISDLLISTYDQENLTLGEIYDDGGRIFTANNSGLYSIQWEERWGSDIFYDAQNALDNNLLPSDTMFKYGFQSCWQMVPFVSDTNQNVINDLIDDFVQKALADHDQLTGGIFITDDIDGSDELLNFVEQWNNASDIERDLLRDEWASSDYFNQNEYAQMLFNESVKDLFLDSMFNPEQQGVNVLGDLDQYLKKPNYKKCQKRRH